MAIPEMRDCGILPGGIHCCTFEEAHDFFVLKVNSAKRDFLWEKFSLFFDIVKSWGIFTAIYIDGSFVTDTLEPGDIDVVLELPENIDVITLWENLFDPEKVKETYFVHIFPWVPEFGIEHDLRFLFQRLKKKDWIARNLEPWEIKGILRVAL